MAIKATIHFLDGQTLEKEFPFMEQPAGMEFTYVGQEPLRIWLDHTQWFEMPNNTILPSSQIAKVVWKELPE